MYIERENIDDLVEIIKFAVDLGRLKDKPSKFTIMDYLTQECGYVFIHNKQKEKLITRNDIDNLFNSFQ